jgi:hypothetical protein
MIKSLTHALVLQERRQAFLERMGRLLPPSLLHFLQDRPGALSAPPRARVLFRISCSLVSSIPISGIPYPLGRIPEFSSGFPVPCNPHSSFS